MKLSFISMLCAIGLFAFPLKAKAHTIKHHNIKTHQVQASHTYTQQGIASWYGGSLIGKKTASGELLTSKKYTIAHKTLPFGTVVKITNLKNGKSVQAKVNDRGPYYGHRIVDLSKATAQAVGIKGIGAVKIETVPPDEVAQYVERKVKK